MGVRYQTHTGYIYSSFMNFTILIGVSFMNILSLILASLRIYALPFFFTGLFINPRITLSFKYCFRVFSSRNNSRSSGMKVTVVIVIALPSSLELCNSIVKFTSFPVKFMFRCINNNHAMLNSSGKFFVACALQSHIGN